MGSLRSIGRRLTRFIAALAVLAPAAAALAAPPVSDDFNTCALLPNTWTFVNPLNDCTATIIGAGSGNAQLRFTLPANVEHDAWVTANNVPRVVQSITNDNFTATIKIDTALATAFQGVGIMALESPTRFVRCELHRGPSGPQVFVASIVNGTATVHVFQAGLATPPMYLRLARTGNSWTPSFSANGIDFTNLGSFNRTLNINQLGPYALNAANPPSPAPAFTANIDFFEVATDPIVSEDQGPVGGAQNTLTINVAGNGSVQVNPPGPVYPCGELVTITAIPGPNTGFAGFTGDLTSQQNPLQVVMTADLTLNATFVTDTTPPQITCPPDFTAEAGNLPPPDFAGVTATDDFDISPTITFSDVSTPAQGNCPTVRIIERTWQATDDAGNSNSCLQTITVEDHTAPQLVGLPTNLNAACDDVPPPPNVTATDAGTPAPIVSMQEFIFDGECAGRFTIQRTWTATDSCGNSSQATRFINVSDTTAPTITLAPTPAVVQCNNIPSAQIPVVTDNCDPAPQLFLNETTNGGSCATGYTLTRTWTAIDACGNTRYASRSFTVVDSIAPVLTMPSDVTIGCGDSVAPSETGFATAIDAADPAPLVTFVDTPIPGACAHSSTISRAWTATDWAGNQSTDIQVITIADTTSPEITGIPPGEIKAECGNAPAPPTPVVTDNCDPAPQVIFSEQLQPTNGDCTNGFTVIRTWRAIDACGNQSTASQTLRFVDTTPPVITIPPDVTLNCNGDGSTSWAAARSPSGAGLASATDNCDADVTITHSDIITPGPGGTPEVFTIKRTWTATDDCGNSASGTQVIQLRDNTPPTIVQCPGDLTTSTQAITGQPKRMAPLPDYTRLVRAIDACSPELTITQSPAPGTMLALGQHVIAFTVADEFGNATLPGACSFVLTLNQHEVIDRCPDDPNKTEPGLCGCGTPDTDSDNDGTPDCFDGCPNDPNKTAPGPCGCGNVEIDTDKDGTPDCIDLCPNDPAKTLPGDCGCGNPETDTDGDGTPDCVDLCPNDPNKIDPGSCGCGTPDLDSDNDGTLDCVDNCPDDPNKTEPGACGCGIEDVDLNLNSTPDCLEVCPTTGDCFLPHPSPGCNSAECCGTVCALDPYCCNTAWDAVCASQANVACEVRVGNECQNPYVISDGIYNHTLADNSGATGDDTNSGDCDVVDTVDEWFAYTAPVNGTATVTTCSLSTNFSTTLAVFDACEGTEITCNALDAQCGFGSTITWEIDFGQTYYIRVSAVDDVVGNYELIVDSEADDVPSDILNITFWYGQNQNFGSNGQPQRQVNLLGNVYSLHGVASLSYRLNGADPLPLSVGPDLRRLYFPGDFNVELFYQNLPAGPNECVIIAQDTQGNIIERTINFTVTQGNVWPLPYAINWATASDIQSVGQVVDGFWQIQAGGVRIMQQGYDRLIAVGDISWTDYEVTVPITIHAIDPNGYLPPSHTPGVGLILRWEGHTDFLEPGSQPSIGYWPLGCAAEYVFHLDQCGYRKQLYGNPFVLRDQDDTCEQLTFGVTYLWKVRVDTQPNGTHFYGFKVWEQGTPEPPGWELTMTETANQPDNGCLLLFSHHVDATFGNVQVVPVP